MGEDVANLNSEFPVAKRNGQRWAEFDSNSTVGSFFAAAPQSQHNLRLLRIIRDQSQRVPVGTYGFSLPVRVPTVMPRDNVWYLSLCSAVTCSSMDDASVVISFVMAGFKHGEAAPASQFISITKSAVHRAPGCAMALLLALMLASWQLRLAC